MMPELPEVETVRRGLEGGIIGKRVLDVVINNSKVIREPSALEFKKGVIGQVPREVIRKGKVLIIKFKEDNFLVIHLRIAGWLLYGDEAEKARVVFRFSKGKCLNYMDQRLLGELKLRKDYRDLKFIKELGPEPFDLSLAEFKKIVQAKKTKIKVLLMDQKIISGIGNIYAQEALFLSKILPFRPADCLNNKEVKFLHQKMISVLNTAIKYKGSSVDIYRNIQGEKGGMEKRLKVYGRKGRPCPRCKKPVEKMILGGRGTCFCPHCQK
ncbi:MAG: bifunctional DNA-formamidopyrimidine glycosylase/DNA-(apurinic or apyrimidinic site) lyase [Candidatus Omnitrophota bacterium]